MAGEATRRGNFVPFGAQSQEVGRQNLQAAVAGEQASPFAQIVAQQMDLPRQSAAPQQSPQPTPRPQRQSGQSEKPSRRGQMPKQAGNVEEKPISPPRREREAGTGRQTTRVRRSREVESGTGNLGDAPALVMDALMEAGAPPAAAAGVAGNLQQESQFDPNAVGDGGNSFGLAQWNRPRAVQLFEFARQKGENVPGLTMDEDGNIQQDLESLANEGQVPSLQTQIDFLVHEAQTTEQSAVQRIFQAATPEQAAVAASRHFFRPGDPRTERRVEFARQLADQFIGEQGQQQPPQSPGLPPAEAPQVAPQQAPQPAPSPAGPFGGGSQGAPMPPAQEAEPRIDAEPDMDRLFREFLSSGDFSVFEKAPDATRPRLLQMLGATLRGQ